MKLINRILFSALSIMVVFPAAAQPPPPPATPIDGGLSLLLIAGGAFGVKKILDKRK